MNDLILFSNYSDNTLDGVGRVSIKDDVITVNLQPGSSATLLRGINKVLLLENDSKLQSITGKALDGDVYTLENSDLKLIVKVQRRNVENTSKLYINPTLPEEAISGKRKTTLTVGILILLLLLVSVFFGVKQKNRAEFSKNSEEKLSQALSDYEKSIIEESIDKTSSRNLFLAAKETARKLKDEGFKSSDLDTLLTNLSNKESEILGEKVVEVNELLDLTLQINNFSASQMVSTGGTIFVFDKTIKSVIQFNSDGKDVRIAASNDDMENIEQVASYEERLFGLSDDGIYELSKGREKIKDSQWGESLIYLYSANIYLVEKNAGQIYRFAADGRDFTDKQDWLAPGIEVDLSKIMDMSIDGSIWLLSSSGKVTKFTNGNPNGIIMEGIVDEISKPTAIYTNEELEFVYILEAEKSRIVVLEKNGDFKLQYVSDAIKAANDLVVSEKEGKIILLTGSKLMYIQI